MPTIVRIVTLSCALLLAAPSFAADAATTATPQPERRQLQRDLEASVLQSQQQVAALQKRIDATSDPALREALNRHIEAAKRESRLDWFRIQLRHAQANGRTDDAKALQAVLDRAALEKVAPLPPLPAETPRPAARPQPARAVSK